MKFDGANGVGATKMKQMAKHLGSSLDVEVFNSGDMDGDILNSGCGAEFVKVQQGPPRGMEAIK